MSQERTPEETELARTQAIEVAGRVAIVLDSFPDTRADAAIAGLLRMAALVAVGTIPEESFVAAAREAFHGASKP